MLVDAGIAQLIERRLAKAKVAGLSPVSRSKEQAINLIPGSNPGGASKTTKNDKTLTKC